MISAASIPIHRRLPWLFLLSLLLLLVSATAVLKSLAAVWQTDEYSHGFFIPVIAALMGWHLLAERRPQAGQSWWGVALLAAGVLLSGVGQLSAFEPCSHYGLWLSLAGLSAAYFGLRVMRVLLPAFIYLVFAIPLPLLIYVGLSQDMQILSSSLGVLPLKEAGIPVFQDGNIIDLGTYQLQVAEACSGLRYLFPLMSFGYLAGFLLQDRMWKRALLFLSTVPLAIGMNSLRIAIIGFTVNRWGIEMARGFLHEFEGWTVFFACICVLMAEAWLLQRIPPRGAFGFHYFGIPSGPLFSGEGRHRAPGLAALCVCAFAALLFCSGALNDRREIIPSHPVFATFRTTLGPWHGEVERIEPKILSVLNLSDYFVADYTRADLSAPVNFYMAYYDRQRIGSSAHSPSNCLPGSGWRIENARSEAVTLADGSTLPVTRMLIRRDGKSQLLYFWFDERGRIISDQYGAKWWLLWDSLLMGRTDGALVRVVTPLAPQESDADGDDRLKSFLQVSYPEIRRYIPGKMR